VRLKFELQDARAAAVEAKIDRLDARMSAVSAKLESLPSVFAQMLDEQLKQSRIDSSAGFVRDSQAANH
jgi:hypothetical protein